MNLNRIGQPFLADVENDRDAARSGIKPVLYSCSKSVIPASNETSV